MLTTTIGYMEVSFDGVERVLATRRAIYSTSWTTGAVTKSINLSKSPTPQIYGIYTSEAYA